LLASGRERNGKTGKIYQNVPIFSSTSYLSLSAILENVDVGKSHGGCFDDSIGDIPIHKKRDKKRKQKSIAPVKLLG